MSTDAKVNQKFGPVLAIASKTQAIPVGMLISFVLLVVFIWSIVAKIDQFTSVSGRIIPFGSIVQVQHFEGGLVDQILVRNGEKVNQDQVLLRIRLSAANQSLEEVAAELAGYKLRRSRLLASLEENELELDPELAQAFPEIARAEIENYNIQRINKQQEYALLQSRRRQEQQSIREIDIRVEAAANELALYQQQLQVKEELEAEGLISELELLDLKTSIEANRGRIQSAREAKATAALKLEETELRLASLEDRYKSELLDQLLNVENGIEQAQLTYDRILQVALRRDVKAPVSGIIKEVYPKTVGAVINPGAVLVEIVPAGEKLVVEAYVPTSERGKISVGQNVVVKVTAYDFLRYGSLDGEVSEISADAFIDDKRGSYYKVIIKLGQEWLGNDPELNRISSGMDVFADIKFTKRNVLSYMLYPVLKSAHNAFRE